MSCKCLRFVGLFIKFILLMTCVTYDNIYLVSIIVRMSACGLV